MDQPIENVILNSIYLKDECVLVSILNLENVILNSIYLLKHIHLFWSPIQDKCQGKIFLHFVSQ